MLQIAALVVLQIGTIVHILEGNGLSGGIGLLHGLSQGSASGGNAQHLAAKTVRIHRTDSGEAYTESYDQLTKLQKMFGEV